MSWGDMAFSGGLSLLKAGVSYSEAKSKAESDRLWQKYNNSMVNISAAISSNNVLTNEMFARDKSIQQGVAIRKSEFLTSASVEATAAASGTTGRSVNAVLFDVQRNAANADANRVNDWDKQEVGFGVQRQQIAQQAMLQQDNRTIRDPSLATTMLGLAGDGAKLYKDNKSEIDKWYNDL